MNLRLQHKRYRRKRERDVIKSGANKSHIIRRWDRSKMLVEFWTKTFHFPTFGQTYLTIGQSIKLTYDFVFGLYKRDQICLKLPLWQNINVLGNFLRVYLPIVKIGNLLWQNFYAIGPILNAVNSQIRKNSLASGDTGLNKQTQNISWRLVLLASD